MSDINQTVELLDSDAIQSVILPENQGFLSRMDIFHTIDSTNTYLLEQAKQSSQSGWICFAEQQTHGRGRRGRSWFSPFGTNIYCSILWNFDQQQSQDLSGLSIAVAVMVLNTLKQYGIFGGLQLKWPNDILYSGRKLSGILLEGCGNSRIVIGIGLNLCFGGDPNAAAEWIDLSEVTGQSVRRNYLAGLLVNELLAKLALYQARGLGAFIDNWREYDVLFGKKITVHTPVNAVSGVMQGVNNAGELLLLDENNLLQQFRCGEVSVRLNY